MNLAGEEEKETCTGKRLRSHDSTTAWGSSSSDAADAAGETERTLTKQARRRPAGAQAAEMEPAQKKRLREGKLKEDEQEKSVKQKLEGDPDPANPHNPQLPGAPPPGAPAPPRSWGVALYHPSSSSPAAAVAAGCCASALADVCASAAC